METVVQRGPKTLSAAVFDRIQRDILRGELVPGAKLRVEELQQRYQVGLTPLREALSRLSNAKLVRAEGQRGYWVAPISMTDLADVLRMRTLIDSEALRRSVALGGDEWESGLVTALHMLSKIERDASQSTYEDLWEQRDGDFHAALVAGCQSPWLITLSRQFYNLNMRYRRLCVARLQIPARDQINEHRSIADAALSRNADLAVQLLTAHFAKTAILLFETNLTSVSEHDRAFLKEELSRARKRLDELARIAEPA